MDRHDRLRSLLRGTGCTVCGASLSGDGIRVLAERDGLVFIELPCPGCGATTLGMVTLPDDGVARLDLASYGEFGPADEARFGSARPVDDADLLAMHRFLASYRGDLRSLIEVDRSGDAGPPP